MVVSNTTEPVFKLSSSTTTKVANNMTTSSISVSSSKNNLVLYHQQTINGPSMQDRHFTQSVTSKTYKMKGNENEIYKSSAIPNGSPSNSPTVNNRNHISNPTNPLGTPTFRRSSTGGDRNRGSMRKMLPALPDMDTQMSLSAKMIDRRTSTPRGNHSYGPFFLEYSLLAEYNLLRKQRLPGVYVIPSTHTPLCWYGIIFIRQGIYQEGIFRFKIIIPENYPDGDCPRVFFDHPVFHPLIEQHSPFEMDVRRGLLKKWRRNVNHIWQILLYVRRAFYKIDTSDPLNQEAADLYDILGKSGERDQFKQQARSCVMEWRDRTFNSPCIDDPHYLTFSPYEPKVHEPVRQAMMTDARKLEQEEEEVRSRNCLSLNTHREYNPYSSNRGHSFIEPGSLKIFSKDSQLHPTSQSLIS